MHCKRTLVIGLGNPILGDDGAGWHITKAAEILCKNTECENAVKFEKAALGGLALMEQMVGYERVIIADSIITPEGNIGTIHSTPLNALPNLRTAHSNSSHDVSLQAALETGRKMRLDLPDDVWVVAVEIAPTYTFSEKLTDPVAAAVSEAADLIQKKVKVQPVPA
jgi:hydrogenase maturation protease